jgi:hypothetical protein
MKKFMSLLLISILILSCSATLAFANGEESIASVSSDELFGELSDEEIEVIDSIAVANPAYLQIQTFGTNPPSAAINLGNSHSNIFYEFTANNNTLYSDNTFYTNNNTMQLAFTCASYPTHQLRVKVFNVNNPSSPVFTQVVNVVNENYLVDVTGLVNGTQYYIEFTKLSSGTASGYCLVRKILN